jgi:hypothetical protein
MNSRRACKSPNHNRDWVYGGKQLAPPDHFVHIEQSRETSIQVADTRMLQTGRLSVLVHSCIPQDSKRRCCEFRYLRSSRVEIAVVALLLRYRWRFQIPWNADRRVAASQKMKIGML